MVRMRTFARNQTLRTGQNRIANVRMRISNKGSHAICESRMKWKWALRPCYCYVSLQCILRQFICFKGYLQEPSTLMTVFMVRNQTIILLFLIYLNLFYPSESVVGAVGSLSYRSHSIFSAFASLVSPSTSSHCKDLA